MKDCQIADKQNYVVSSSLCMMNSMFVRIQNAVKVTSVSSFSLNYSLFHRCWSTSYGGCVGLTGVRPQASISLFGLCFSRPSCTTHGISVYLWSNQVCSFDAKLITVHSIRDTLTSNSIELYGGAAQVAYLNSSHNHAQNANNNQWGLSFSSGPGAGQDGTVQYTVTTDCSCRENIIFLCTKSWDGNVVARHLVVAHCHTSKLITLNNDKLGYTRTLSGIVFRGNLRSNIESLTATAELSDSYFDAAQSEVELSNIAIGPGVFFSVSTAPVFVYFNSDLCPYFSQSKKRYSIPSSIFLFTLLID